MRTVQRTLTLLLLGFTTLAAMSAVGGTLFTADALSGFRSITIKPSGSLKLETGEHILLTADGDYVTYNIPINAVWNIESGAEFGSFAGQCIETEQCTFRAGDRGGQVHIRATGYYGKSDTVVITVAEPSAPVPVHNPFNDEIPSWAGEPIVRLSDKRILRGYDDGRFGAGDALTRGQLVVLIFRALTDLKLVTTDSVCRIPYQDVPQGHYAYEAACTFRNEGWTDSLSTLDPNAPLTRSEAASLLARSVGPALLEAQSISLKTILSNGAVFRDIPETHGAFTDTAIVASIGLMKGNPDGTFAPAGILNRAQAATIVWRMMEALREEGVRGL